VGAGKGPSRRALRPIQLSGSVHVVIDVAGYFE
jgi:hypothetical protein